MAPDRALEGTRCNIGPAEIARRQRIAIALTIACAVLVAVLVAIHAPIIARGLLWPVASATAVTWLQVVRKFCVRFGLGGLQNFGPLGGERAVPDQLREEDRRRATYLIFEGVLAGLLATVAFYNLPL